MALIAEIRAKFELDKVEFTRHATARVLTRKIAVQEIREAIAVGEIIVDYPDDKYGPTCLIFGFTTSLRPLHIQCSHPSRDILKVVAVYEPKPDEWVEFRKRRTDSNVSEDVE